MSQDKRRMARRAALIKIIYRADDDIASPGSGAYHFGTITNSSRGGVGLRVEHAHRVRERIWIEGLGDSARRFAGIVTWIRHTQAGYAMGVKLIQAAS